MRGYSEFRGFTYRLEFDANTQSFVQRPVSAPGVSLARDEIKDEGEILPLTLAFKRRPVKSNTPAAKPLCRIKTA